MTTRSKCVIFLLFLLPFALGSRQSIAQAPQKGHVWKKSVSRRIDIGVIQNGADTSLFAFILKAIRENKLSAYAGRSGFGHKLSVGDVNELLAAKPDTQLLPDLPIAGNDTMRVVWRDFDMDSIHSYRVYEDWEMDPTSGAIEVEITGLAPVTDVYGQDGLFRGSRSMFVVHYDEAQDMLMKYDRSHPKNAVIQHIWDDHFVFGIKVPRTEEENNDTSQRFKKKLITVVDMAEQQNMFDPSVSQHIEDESRVQSFPELLFGAIDSGDLAAYPMYDTKYMFKEQLEIKEVDAMVYPGHVAADGFNAVFNQCIGGVGFSSLSWIHNYAILEDHSFNPYNGKMKIQILAVSPIGNKYDANGRPHRQLTMFWLKYSDIGTLTAQYEEYHPKNSLAGHIWDAFFYQK